jgi:hypothetical protein
LLSTIKELVETRLVELLASIFVGNATLARRAPQRVYATVAK